MAAKRAAVLLAALALTFGSLHSAAAQDRRNWLGDPFEQATHGLPACPAPEGPLIDKADLPRYEHDRVERGTTCWRVGRCLLPNSYRYDKLINDAVVRGIQASGAYADTQVWVQTQRRIVFLQGCVRSAAQKAALEAQAHQTETVDLVINELMVGSSGTPGYAVAR
ncbi:MAG: BON domain-containing protein [Betaproteobacteria bacterium]|nr:BON domain-containing protein [Betaproteobacteria bacterium]